MGHGRHLLQNFHFRNGKTKYNNIEHEDDMEICMAMDTNSQRQHAPGDKNRSFFLFEPRKSAGISGGKGSPSVSLIGSQNQSRPVLTSSVCVPRLHTCGVAVFFPGISVSSGKSVWDAFQLALPAPSGTSSLCRAPPCRLPRGCQHSERPNRKSQEDAAKLAPSCLGRSVGRASQMAAARNLTPNSFNKTCIRNENVRSNSNRQCNGNRHGTEERTRSLFDCCNLTAPCAGPMKPGPLIRTHPAAHSVIVKIVWMTSAAIDRLHQLLRQFQCMWRLLRTYK